MESEKEKEQEGDFQFRFFENGKTRVNQRVGVTGRNGTKIGRSAWATRVSPFTHNFWLLEQTRVVQVV
jgi:hypothetical protein